MPKSINRHAAKVFISAIHALGWTLFLISAAHVPSASSAAITVGTGFVAYLLGLRHAFDLDHLSAIDNTTRRFLNDGKKTNNIGLFFALGHSTIVVGLSLVFVLGFRNLGTQLLSEGSPIHKLLVLVGTGVAAIFLVCVALANLGALVQIGVQLIAVRRHGYIDENRIANVLASRGAVNRIVQPFMKLVDRPWKMFPVGLLFGLGLDTATSIALLTASGSNALGQNNFVVLLALPLVFTAGMALGDSTNSSIMTKIYQWAMDKPQRRLTVNFGTTFVSIAVAFTCAVPLALSTGSQLFG